MWIWAGWRAEDFDCSRGFAVVLRRGRIAQESEGLSLVQTEMCLFVEKSTRETVSSRGLSVQLDETPSARQAELYLCVIGVH